MRTVLHKWLYRFQRSGVPPTGKGMPMRRLGGALGDLYRLGGKVGKVVKEALIFGHSVAEKVP